MPSNRLSTSFSSASRRLTLYSVRSDWVSRSRIERSISLRKGANLPTSPAFSFSRKTACRMVASWIAWFAAIWCVLVVQAQAVALLLQFAVDLQVSGGRRRAGPPLQGRAGRGPPPPPPRPPARRRRPARAAPPHPPRRAPAPPPAPPLGRGAPPPPGPH